MKPDAVYYLLLSFAALEFAIGLVMLVMFGNLIMGGSSIAVGAALVAVATSQRKKKSNG